ncbi:MAG: polysaccharide deacetylase family protein, partial [Bradyrhizobium sp.]|nr:polysaccharide deacetylase family protein [Bradyrhizobium sp.]
MAAETPHAAKGKAAKSRAPRTAHAAHGTLKHAAQAKGTTPRPTRIATGVKKRA